MGEAGVTSLKKADSGPDGRRVIVETLAVAWAYGPRRFFGSVSIAATICRRPSAENNCSINASARSACAAAMPRERRKQVRYAVDG